jgi:Gas vesicle synthesis protein GvpL/GvpF
MPGSATQDQARERQPEAQTACYVYGIVPADNPPDPGARGVGDPPGLVSVVRHRDLAALVSEVDMTRPLGTPEDLLAHQRLLDEASAEATVLPMRFGGVVTDPEAVAAELLEPCYDEFAAALEEVSGRGQFVVTGRYDEQAVLAGILAEDPEAARLREEIRDQGERDETVTRPARIQLGEIIGIAIAAMRDADNAEAAQAFEPLCTAIAVREPSHEFASAHVALLVDKERQAELEQAYKDLARAWEGRVRLRLLGPMAPYDFVTSPGTEG